MLSFTQKSTAGRCMKFVVPLRWLYERRAQGWADELLDLYFDAQNPAKEWRFFGPASKELNDYLVPQPPPQ